MPIKKIKEIWSGTEAHHKLIKGSSIVFMLSILSAGIGYLMRIVMARILTPEEIGLFFAILTVLLFFYFLKDIGLGQALPKFIAEFRVFKKYNEIKTIIIIYILCQIILAGIICLIFFCLAGYLQVHYFKHPDAKWLLRVMLLYILSGIGIKIYKAVFHGFQKITHYASVEPIRNLLALVSLLLLGQFGLVSAVVAYIGSGFLIWLIFLKPFLNTFSLFKYKLVDMLGLTKRMLWFGFPLFLTDIGGEIIAYVDTFALTFFRSLAEVGIYNVVLPMAMLFMMIGRAISVVIYPMIAEHWAKKEYDVVAGYYKLFYKIYPVSIALFVIAWIFSKPVLAWFFTKEYLAGLIALRILFAACLMYTMGRINLQGLAGIGHAKENAKALLSTAAINIVGDIILAPFYGINGVACATLIAYIWLFIYSTLRVKKLILNANKNTVKI